MKKSLVIVESPSKAKTLNKLLGSNFIVKSSVGHIKDLPEGRLGIDIQANFKPEYVIKEGKNKVIKDLKRAAELSDKIFLAPDPDREGEAIAWHLKEILQPINPNIYRVLFYEITKDGIKKGMANPQQIDINKFEAQQARRILDRLVGYQISPILWEKVEKGLSAGRVQSVALRLICDREKEIADFKPEEYWTIEVNLRAFAPPSFKAKLIKIDGEDAKIPDQKTAQSLVEEIKTLKFEISSVKKGKKLKNPLPPFITSTLQQDAAIRLGFSPAKTMQIAQSLYEGVSIDGKTATGLITYMRTDSTRIAESFQKIAREYIAKRFGEKYLPSVPHKYHSKKTAQEAHEAIRPTSLVYDPLSVKSSLSKDQFLLYQMIFNRFLASQIAPAQLEITTAEITAGRFMFRASSTKVIFDGYLALYADETSVKGKDDEKDEEPGTTIPPIKEGEKLELLGIEPFQHFTKPPPRYSEASLVKTLEDLGVGRPSTYASILSVLMERDYARLEARRFIPTQLGMIVNELLKANFPDIVDPTFTAKMEEDLDRIEAGEKIWDKAIREFYDHFSIELEKAKNNIPDSRRDGLQTDILCEVCGAKMVVKKGKFGNFLSCSRYPECQNRKPLEEKQKSKKLKYIALNTEDNCQKCRAKMVLRISNSGPFLACSAYPNCKNAKPYQPEVKCPAENCTGKLIERKSKKGKKFFGCSKYPKCNFILTTPPFQENCPSCGFPILKFKKIKGVYHLVCGKECGYTRSLEKVETN